MEDEARCPKSGYSIAMLVHVHDSALRQEAGGCVEFDGPSHFFASGPTGETLLKRRHLELRGHALVSVSYWECSGCKGAGEREQHLRGKAGSDAETRHSNTTV